MTDRSTLEERVAALERQVQELQTHGQLKNQNEHWLDSFIGSLSDVDESSFDQMVEYGHIYRESGGMDDAHLEELQRQHRENDSVRDVLESSNAHNHETEHS